MSLSPGLAPQGISRSSEPCCLWDALPWAWPQALSSGGAVLEGQSEHLCTSLRHSLGIRADPGPRAAFLRENHAESVFPSHMVRRLREVPIGRGRSSEAAQTPTRGWNPFMLTLRGVGPPLLDHLQGRPAHSHLLSPCPLWPALTVSSVSLGLPRHRPVKQPRPNALLPPAPTWVEAGSSLLSPLLIWAPCLYCGSSAHPHSEGQTLLACDLGVGYRQLQKKYSAA